MPRVCFSSGKKTTSGNAYARRGLAKAKGGVGKKITGKTKRKFRANLQKIRVILPNGSIKKIRVATSVIKRGLIDMKVGDRTVRIPLVKAMRRGRRELSAEG